MAVSGLGVSPFSKERLDAGNGIQLGVAYDGKEVYDITYEDEESVSDAVGRSAGQLGQIGVTGLDGVREQQGLGDFVHNMEAAIVVESRDDVETVALQKVPGLTRMGLVMDENLAAKWDK